MRGGEVKRVGMGEAEEGKGLGFREEMTYGLSQSP